MSSISSTGRLPIAAVLAAVAALAGCAADPHRPQPPARSAATTAVPIIFSVKDRLGLEYITRVKVDTWLARDDSGQNAAARDLVAGVAFVGVSFRDKRLPLRIVRLADVEAATWEGSSDRAANAIVVAGQALPNVERVSVMVCPADIAAPRRSDCVEAASGQFEFQFANGFVRKAPMKEAAPWWTFWDNTTWCLANSTMDEYLGRVPTMSCPEGKSTHRILAREPAALQASFDLRAQKWAQVAQDAERLRKGELERK